MIIKIKLTERLLPILEKMAEVDKKNARWICNLVLDHYKKGKRGQPIVMTCEEAVNFLEAVDGISLVTCEVS